MSWPATGCVEVDEITRSSVGGALVCAGSDGVMSAGGELFMGDSMEGIASGTGCVAASDDTGCETAVGADSVGSGVAMGDGSSGATAVEERTSSD